MIKKVLLWFIVVFVLVFSVSALGLSVNNISLEIAKGQSASKTLTLTNEGNKNVTATFPSSVITLTSTTNSSNKLTATIKDTSLNIPSSSTNSTTITVNAPTDAAKETYQENVTANYDGESVKFTISVDVVEPVYSINVKNTYFGDVDQNETVTKTIKITNNGNTALTNVKLSHNIAGKYQIRFNQTPFNLAINEIKEIVITASIPKDESIGNRSIGSVDVLTDQYNFTSAFSLYANVMGKLIIDDLDVIIDKDIEGNRVSSTNLNDGDKIDEKARPGSKIEIYIKLKNQFDEDSNIEIRDIVITATVRDIDEGEDIEVESDEFDLDANERSDTKTLEFNVPLIVERETYDIEIHVEGEDDNDVIHEIDWTIYLEVDKKSHDVIVYKAEIEPSTIICSRKTNLNIELLNLGKGVEDEVKLEVINSGLDLNFVEEDIELEKGIEEDNIYEKTIPIEVNEDVKAGSYPITIKVYYNDDILDDYKTINLKIEDCKIAEEEEEKEEEKETVIVEEEEEEEEPPKEEGPEIIVGEVPEADVSVEKPFTKSPTYIALLLLANTIVVIGTVGLAGKFLISKI